MKIPGKLIKFSYRCNIDLIHTPSNNHDVIFHMSIRPNENAIVRNTFHNGRWGPEERDGPCVRENETFEIMISADREFFKLALNGQYLGNYRYRLPLHLIEYVKVSGMCSIDHILIEQDMSGFQPINPYPQPINPYPQPINPYQQPAMGISTSHYATPSAPPRPFHPQMMVNIL